ncbi:ribosome biogenesis protein WDR12 [Strongylocentrotus purpuratus]|uniref:Ribosome biogenesis protein WDR12 homolog n=1 Tax=Strongylocentrotus purpuratus TaxID=7668 RepID=A0A7M7P616_STRPU|nr:ribosome biogenesis protein WDR12 [Strongylocentrotus purpuratus]
MRIWIFARVLKICKMAASTSSSVGSHLQARFFTKQKRFVVGNTPFSVPANVGVTELSSLINKLLNEDKAEEDIENVEFDFLIEGEFLRVPLASHFEVTQTSTEAVVDIEYVVKQTAPEPVGSILHDDWVSCIHNDGDRILTGCYDNGVRLWGRNGDNIATLQYHTDPVKCVCWIKSGDPVSLLVSGSHDQTLIIWEWNEREKKSQPLHVCKGHAMSVDAVAVDQSQTRICSGSFDKMLKVWSAVPSSGEEEPPEIQEQQKKRVRRDDSTPIIRTPISTLDGHKEAVSSVIWTGKDEVCSASWDHTIQMWDVAQGSNKSNLTGTKAFLSLSHSPLNGLLASGSVDRHVRLWDPRIKDGAVVKSSLTHHNGWVSSVAWSPSNKDQLLSGSYDKALKLWDIRSPKAPLFNMTGLDDKILTVDWSIPDLLLCGGADNCLHMFSTAEALSTTESSTDGNIAD